MKNIRKLISCLILLGIFFTSCKKKVDGGSMDLTRILVTVVDQQSKNLLDPPSQLSVDVNYVVNGVQRPTNIGGRIIEYKGKNVFELLPNSNKEEELPITTITFGNNKTDTIKCKIIRDGGVTLCTKVWLNGELKWEDGNGDRAITIIK